MKKIEKDEQLSIGGEKTSENFKTGWNKFIEFCE